MHLLETAREPFTTVEWAPSQGSTVMRFDTAMDVTASELRIELMFPD